MVLVTGSGAIRQATVTTATGHLSAGDRRVHLGLGSEQEIRSIKIRWPSGILQRLTDVRVDRILTAEEPDIAHGEGGPAPAGQREAE